MRTSSLYWLSAVSLGLSMFVGGCEQSGEALNDRKQRENDTEIQSYLTQKSLTAEKSDLGIYFVKTKPVPDGQEPKTGDEVQYNYVSRRLDDLVVDSTYSFTKNPVTETLIPGTNSSTGISVGQYINALGLRNGEEVTLLVPYNLRSGTDRGSLLLPQYSPVRYDLRIVSVKTEDQRIDEYIAANKINVTQKTDDGIRIAVTQARPDSAQVVVGKTPTVKYTGRLLNGVTFQPTATNSYRIGENKFTPAGLESSLTKLRVGEKAQIIFPSALGYGAQGRSNNDNPSNSVRPYTPLIFEVEVTKIQ